MGAFGSKGGMRNNYSENNRNLDGFRCKNLRSKLPEHEVFIDLRNCEKRSKSKVKKS